MAFARVFPGHVLNVALGGTAIIPIVGPVAGGWIINPASADDQGLAISEPLFVDSVFPAGTAESGTTNILYPGDWFPVPAGVTANFSVNAASSDHRFTSFYWQDIDYPPGPSGDTFPPNGPVTITKTIPSYLYWEYADDDNLQYFVRAYNQLTQGYVDWFTNVGLPVYTGDMIAGALLDLVGEGIYGIPRPVLPSGHIRLLGPYNTMTFNEGPFNDYELLGPTNYYATSDDTYKRIITWDFYKGDGKHFTVRWLKRRIMRFLAGVNGTAPNIDQTYQVSITFGTNNQININLLSSVRTVTGGALYNRMLFNEAPYNDMESTVIALTPLTGAATLKAAIDAGVLELPFQFTYVVHI